MSEKYLDAVSRLLVYHQIINSPEVLSKNNFEEKIALFQEKAGLFVDGDLGKDTLWKLQFPFATNSNRLHWVKCEADIAKDYDGYPHLFLRSDAAMLYDSIREEILSFGGLVTTAGGKRSLSARVNQHRSSKSMHYVGLAFDLSVTSGFFNPKKDPFVIVKNDKSLPYYWTVYVRAPRGAFMRLKATYWKNWNSGKDLKLEVEGNFINFTETCIKYGLNPISPRKAYLRKNNRKYLSSEWWHFQANSLLIPKFSQFGVELLKIEGYDYDNLVRLNQIWENRKVIFKENWF